MNLYRIIAVFAHILYILKGKVRKPLTDFGGVRR